MKKLIQRSYNAIRKRGLIKDETSIQEFVSKMIEEDSEFMQLYIERCHDIQNLSRDEISELIDSITVRVMLLHHLGYDFETEFEKIVIKNESRND